MGQGTSQLDQREPGDDVLDASDAGIQRTREEMSETLEAIQAKLSPEQITDDAKHAAVDTVDHALDKVREVLPELTDQARESAREATELASVAAMEAVDHAVAKLQEALPDISQHAQDAAREAVDHAIEEAKAAVRELGQQTKVAVRDATIGRVERMAQMTNETSKQAGSTVMSTIKQNPGPAALTALGVGWLVMNGRSSAAKGGSSQPGASSTNQGESGGVAEQAQAGMSQAQERAGEMASTVQDGISTAAGQVAEGAGTVADSVVQGAGSVGSGVASGAASVAGGVQGTVAGATNQAKQMPGRLRHMVEENPMRLGMVAVAIGSAAALVVPETQRENQMLGQARDSVIERAQATAQSTIEKVQQVAEDVGETVEKTAQDSGLSNQGS